MTARETEKAWQKKGSDSHDRKEKVSLEEEQVSQLKRRREEHPIKGFCQDKEEDANEGGQQPQTDEHKPWRWGILSMTKARPEECEKESEGAEKQQVSSEQVPEKVKGAEAKEEESQGRCDPEPNRLNFKKAREGCPQKTKDKSTQKALDHYPGMRLSRKGEEFPVVERPERHREKPERNPHRKEQAKRLSGRNELKVSFEGRGGRFSFGRRVRAESTFDRIKPESQTTLRS